MHARFYISLEVLMPVCSFTIIANFICLKATSMSKVIVFLSIVIGKA